MAKIVSMGLENMRRLRHVNPNLRIAPITVLLGRNSVGKSTFARVFPLLRQSSERRKRSPVLWFGDLVDFGSIGKAISEGQDAMSFSFEVEFKKTQPNAWLTPGATYYAASPRTTLKKATVTLKLAEDVESKSGYAKHLKIDVFGGSIEMDLPLLVKDGNSIKINGEITTVPKDSLVISYQGDFLPLLAFYKRQFDIANQTASWTSGPNPWIDNAAQVIKRLLHGNTGTATARRLASQVQIGTIEEISKSLQTIKGPHSWMVSVAAEGTRQTLARRLHHAFLSANAGVIIQQIDTELTTYFAGVRYIKPLRAIAERYYRRVDLSVSEIDPEGRNLPMFLDSLTSHQLENFRAWIKLHLDIDAYPAREGDQLMVMAQGKHDIKPFNVADMGFGISQVLPIAAQLWATVQKVANTKRASIVVLEQPELHLHPEYQARLADVFAGTVKETQADVVPIIIETHSQQIVNRLGQLIESEVLQPEDVAVYLFESSETEEATTTVRRSEFDRNGILKNWPFGFFEPEVR